MLALKSPVFEKRLSQIQIHFYYLPSITTFVKRFSFTWVGRLPCGARTLLIDTMSRECVRCGLVVRICGSHPQGPGSIPGNGIVFTFSTMEIEKHQWIRVLDVSIEKPCFRKTIVTDSHSILLFTINNYVCEKVFVDLAGVAATPGPNTTHRHNVERMCPLWSSG